MHNQKWSYFHSRQKTRVRYYECPQGSKAFWIYLKLLAEWAPWTQARKPRIFQLMPWSNRHCFENIVEVFHHAMRRVIVTILRFVIVVNPFPLFIHVYLKLKLAILIQKHGHRVLATCELLLSLWGFLSPFSLTINFDCFVLLFDAAVFPGAINCRCKKRWFKWLIGS